MKTIEEKATYYATMQNSLPGYDSAIRKAYLAGATEALAGQWRSGDNPPKHNHIVFVLSDADEYELRHTTAYYQDDVWNFPDDWYYGCKVLKWMEPPKDESK